MNRTSFVFVLVIVVSSPLLLLAYFNWDAIQQSWIKARFLSRTSISPKYAVETKIPGLNVLLVNTAFLEYISATMHLYDADAIVDPEIYFGNKNTTRRHTVSQVKFELVPTLTQYMVGLGGSTDFASRGTYVVNDNILIVRVSLDEAQLEKSSGNIKFNMEDIFLDTALQVLVYATSKSGESLNLFELNKMQKALKENIPTGIFQRPLKIDVKQ